VQATTLHLIREGQALAVNVPVLPRKEERPAPSPEK